MLKNPEKNKGCHSKLINYKSTVSNNRTSPLIPDENHQQFNVK